MKYALFLGCTIPARALHYELSARKVAEKLGIELVDMPGASCCGMPMVNVNRHASMVMSAGALAQAEEMGLNIVTLCSACNSTLSEVSEHLRHDKAEREKVNAELTKLGKKGYKGEAKVIHFSKLLFETIGIKGLKEKIEKPLKGATFVTHSGCHYLKPSEVFSKFDNPEAPATLNELVKATGATVKTIVNPNECCGGGILGIKENTAVSIAAGKLDRIKQYAGDIDGLVLHCPFCNIQYEAHQKKLERDSGKTIDIPVVFLPQILGLALGIPDTELGFNQHKVKPKSLLEKFAPAPAAAPAQ
jgi:heterodisulfide reductase subunit B